MSSTMFPLLGVGLGIAFLAASPTDRLPRILWNASTSLPIGFYRLSASEPLSVGDLVAVELPSELAAWAAARGYLGRSALLLKRVAASPRAKVCRIGDVIHVDGIAVAEALKADSHGRAMPVWQSCVVLAENQFFLLLAESPDSLDGRYFGPSDAVTVVGMARPIWTWGG
jgi:conjugative transfer signal peptidase TraF